MIYTVEERKNSIRKVIKSLDITPSMFKNAEEKYKNIANFLNVNGLHVNISLQGSFAIGTATKPYSKGEDREYDVDTICTFIDCNLQSTDIRKKLISVLKQSELYDDKIEEWPKCVTINYAEFNGYNFSIDLVPTIQNDDISIKNLGVSPKYYENILALAIKNGNSLLWNTINPSGYKVWFDDINFRFANYNRDLRMKKIFESQDAYAKIEELPEYFNKSALQEAIQILKRNRDIYYSKIDKEENKPASIIITTFAALVSQNYPENIDSIDLALNIIKELKCYSYTNGGNSVITPIIMHTNKWEFYNPVNSKDNLLDSWNENNKNAELFFNWIDYAEKSMKEILDVNSLNYIDKIGNSFGNIITDMVFERDTVSTIKNGVKPYHE